MKTIIHLTLLCMAMLMLQSCRGASHKNSDSETENDATEESLESLSDISFKTIPDIYMDSQGKWKIRPLTWRIIVYDDSGTPIMYDEKMAANYDSLAFAFFYATSVVSSYCLAHFDKWFELTFNSKTEALNKWESDYAPQLDPYLTLCLNLPVTDDTCPPQIRDWFNEPYYEYQHERMYLWVPSYNETIYDYHTSREYQIANGDSHPPTMYIQKFDDEDFPEYHGALSIFLAPR